MCNCSLWNENPHYAVLQRVIELLRCIRFDCFRSDEIYEAEFPFISTPSHGLAVSMLTEQQGKGTVAAEDYGYGIQVTRVLRSLGQKGYVADRSAWRKKITRYFSNKKICPPGVCEILTKVTPANIDIPNEFARSGVDASVMQIWVWVREFPECGILSGNTISCSECRSC